jgi:hypothetical protein
MPAPAIPPTSPPPTATYVSGDSRGMLGSRDLARLLPRDSDEAVEVQAKPYGRCRRENDANDKPEKHEQKFVAHGGR